jgi:transposase
LRICTRRRGAPRFPPERLLGAKVLMALYSVRSDRQFCERLRYDLLFQWFLDINPDETHALFDASTFSKNQERLIGHATAQVFFAQVVELAREGRWVSNEHFSADGTLIEAWASMKSFRPKDDRRKDLERESLAGLSRREAQQPDAPKHDR